MEYNLNIISITVAVSISIQNIKFYIVIERKLTITNLKLIFIIKNKLENALIHKKITL